MAAKDYTTLELAGRDVRLSSPSQVFFPEHDAGPAITELELAKYPSAAERE